MEKVKSGSTVKVNYTGRLEDGLVFDSSLEEGREPLEAKLGEGLLIRGFENGLMGMAVGEKKTIEIPADEAYGQYNPDMLAEIPSTQIPEGTQIGDVLQGNGPAGPVMVKIVEFKENTVVIDANHPLAGKNLIFDLELVELN